VTTDEEHDSEVIVQKFVRLDISKSPLRCTGCRGIEN
jgi:hypothetical protein